MADTNDLQGILGFQWGPLQQTEDDTELSLRLMRAAAHAKEWDAKRGVLAKHPRDLPNLFVEKLLPQAKVFAEFILHAQRPQQFRIVIIGWGGCRRLAFPAPLHGRLFIQ